ncbi:hypothetical protein MKEN_00569500 [Mycena kentingensis (nom. inval.)]|nr:hypothetical protein MKEN_00569500 [Mycena kentingensis (nom. inval.)]
MSQTEPVNPATSQTAPVNSNKAIYATLLSGLQELQNSPVPRTDSDKAAERQLLGLVCAVNGIPDPTAQEQQQEQDKDAEAANPTRTRKDSETKRSEAYEFLEQLIPLTLGHALTVSQYAHDVLHPPRFVSMAIKKNTILDAMDGIAAPVGKDLVRTAHRLPAHDHTPLPPRHDLPHCHASPSSPNPAAGASLQNADAADTQLLQNDTASLLALDTAVRTVHLQQQTNVYLQKCLVSARVIDFQRKWVSETLAPTAQTRYIRERFVAANPDLFANVQSHEQKLALCAPGKLHASAMKDFKNKVTDREARIRDELLNLFDAFGTAALALPAIHINDLPGYQPKYQQVVRCILPFLKEKRPEMLKAMKQREVETRRAFLEMVKVCACDTERDALVKFFDEFLDREAPFADVPA